MKATFATTAAFLSATTYASTVTLQTTKCISGNPPIEQFEIELNTQEAVPKLLSSVCGLEIISASSDWYLKDIQCQAFKDVEGTVPGSAVFTYDEPAKIATNPVQEQSIHCIVSVTPSETLKRRQVFPSSISDELFPTTGVVTSDLLPTGVITSDLVGTPSPRPAASSSTTDDSSSDDDSTTTSGASEFVTRSTVLITSTASGLTTVETLPSSGMPSSTNGTSLSTTRPTPSQSSPSPSETNAAGQAAIGLGVVAAAFAALAL